MRLWHYKLIPFLPNSQLIAQWRELNSIFKKQDKHILINYVYEYPKEDFETIDFNEILMSDDFNTIKQLELECTIENVQKVLFDGLENFEIKFWRNKNLCMKFSEKIMLLNSSFGISPL